MGERRRSLLLLRGGYHREFALKTLLRKNWNILIADRPSCREFGYADRSYALDDIRTPEVMFELAKKIHGEVPFDGAITFSDSCVVALGMLSDYYGFDYFGEGIARILTNKFETRRYLKGLGIDSTDFFCFHSLEEVEEKIDRLKFPCVLKPTDRAGGDGVQVVRRREEIESAYYEGMEHSIKKEIIVEDFLPGDEYCVEVFIMSSEVYFLSISEKHVTDTKYCIELFDITPAPIDDDLKKRIEAFLYTIIKEMPLNIAVLHIEIRVNNGEIKIVEINPRPAGGTLLESLYHLKGFNVYSFIFDAFVNRDIDMSTFKGYLTKPFNGYTLLYSFITPEVQGRIKKIRGIDGTRRLLRGCAERIMLAYDHGDYLKYPATNTDTRGMIYLMGNDPGELLQRAKAIEEGLVFEVEEER